MMKVVSADALSTAGFGGNPQELNNLCTIQGDWVSGNLDNEWYCAKCRIVDTPLMKNRRMQPANRVGGNARMGGREMS
ncbi:hypothetical protein [Aeoliella sp.]|uniref:hypothetical protein n=1 Tax=Aeoliella sp. TaxID=2795800 RepID=UPI003CCBC4BA